MRSEAEAKPQIDDVRAKLAQGEVFRQAAMRGREDVASVAGAGPHSPPKVVTFGPHQGLQGKANSPLFGPIVVLVEERIRSTGGHRQSRRMVAAGDGVDQLV